MPITVACPGCNSRLNAPDTAAGKKVKCPKCAAMLTVPSDDFEVVGDDFEVVDNDFEVVDDAPVKAKPKKAVKRVMADDDDDDDPPRRSRDADDDEDDRPKKKGKKKFAPKKQNSMMPLIIGGAVIVLLLGAVGGFFLLSGKKGASKISESSWVLFDAPDGSFAASFPETAPTSADLFEILSRGNAAELAESRSQMDMLKGLGITSDGWSTSVSGRRYIIGMMKFPEAAAGMVKSDQVMKGMMDGVKKGIERSQGKEKILFEKSVTVAGQPGQQFGVGSTTTKQVQIFTAFFANNRVYFVGVEGDEIAETDANYQSFLDKFELKTPANATTTPPGGGRRRR